MPEQELPLFLERTVWAMTVLGCIAFENDWRWLVIAVLICLIGAWATIGLFERASMTISGERAAWNLLTALVGGSSIWCTHFIAILGYRPGVPVTLDAALTIASLLVAIAGIATGAAVATGSKSRLSTFAVATTTGIAISAVHYVGLLAYRVQGIVSWDGTYLAASVALAVGLSALCFHVLRNTNWAHKRAKATGLLVMAILSLHFTGMTAFRVKPLSLDGGGLETRELAALAAAIAAIVLLVIGAAFCVRLIDRSTRAEIAEAFDNMSTGVLMIAPSGVIRFYNNRVFELFGLAPDAISIGSQIEQFLNAIGRAAGWYEARTHKVIENHYRWMDEGETIKVEQYFDDGKTISISARPLRAGGMIVTYDDVTALRESQKQINHMAFHDALTGLANRRGFADHLARLSPHSDFSLLMIDLDRFKPVNDKFGHAVGDEVLAMVAGRLRENCRSTDLVFRLGGDEMAVLLLVAPHEGYALAKRIVECLSQPYQLRGNTIEIGASIGVAFSRRGDEASLVQHNADLALYAAKEAGRGRVIAFDRDAEKREH